MQTSVYCSNLRTRCLAFYRLRTTCASLVNVVTETRRADRCHARRGVMSHRWHQRWVMTSLAAYLSYRRAATHRLPVTVLLSVMITKVCSLYINNYTIISICLFACTNWSNLTNWSCRHANEKVWSIWILCLNIAIVKIISVTQSCLYLFILIALFEL